MNNFKQQFNTFLARFGITRVRSGESLGYSIFLAGIVGVMTGFGAVAFHLMTVTVADVALGWVVGYDQGHPINEPDVHLLKTQDRAEHVIQTSGGEIVDERLSGLAGVPESRPPRIWLLLIVPAAGGLLSGWIVYKYAPSASGGGADNVIRAYHHESGHIDSKVPFIKMVSSAITLGTGGSGGREGPIAQIGAGMGSWLGTKLNLTDNQRRMLLASGLGSGIGAIFHAPLAGAIFATEVLYRDPEFESEALIPGFIATAVSYSIYSLVFGLNASQPLFDLGFSDLTVSNPLLLLLPLAVLAVVVTGGAWLHVAAHRSAVKIFNPIPIPTWTKPGLGAGLAGIMAILLYFGVSWQGGSTTQQHDVLSVLSYGYGFLQKLLSPEVATLGIGLCLAVGFGKIATTAVTIGSGGSAGHFGPAVVIGGALGAAVGITFHQLMPGFISQEEVLIFTILGMAGFFAAAANTPVSTLIMVSELTASYVLLLPAMWVCALSYLIGRRLTIYEVQPNNRLESPAHRGDFIVDILKGLSVRDALADSHRKFITVNLDSPLDEISRMITSTLQSSFAVLDKEGRYYGLFSLNDIRQFLYESKIAFLAVAQDLATVDVEPLTEGMDMSDALSRFAQSRFDELPVVTDDDQEHVVAMLRRQDLISVYNKRLLAMRSGKA